ncbi:MAG TPA: prenyltransferase [Chloroflexota bacterium]
MKVDDALQQLSRFPFGVLITLDPQGYPLAVATEFRVQDQALTLTPVSTGSESLRDSQTAQMAFSHIRPLPGYGYDERAYIELTGSLSIGEDTWTFTPRKARGWDENTLPFFELCERALPQARRYMQTLGRERGEPVGPRMGWGWKLFNATRAPFLTATLVPVGLGLAAAAYDGPFSWKLATLTTAGAAAAHLGINITNDIFDTRSGADELNVTPTMFSGGSRVLQYGLLSMREMSAIAGACYAIAIGSGLALVPRSGTGLLGLGAAGFLIGYFYTAPPVQLVHHGLGELAVAVGFGPIMVLGSYYVQRGHYALRPAILSIPVALFVMLILYANEIPDRIADARAGKRTLVVRLSPRTVVKGYVAAASAAYGTVAAGVAAGILPAPTLASLATIPLAARITRGINRHYDRPYEVMQTLQDNIVLHLATGALLIGGVLAGRRWRRSGRAA